MLKQGMHTSYEQKNGICMQKLTFTQTASKKKKESSQCENPIACPCFQITQGANELQ